MIVSDKFVYLHLPKTGGTFVTEILKKIHEVYPHLNIKELIKLKHKGLNSIPKYARGVPIVTSVRPPHDHYISRYEFRWWRRPNKKEFRPGLVRKHFPTFPNLSFSDFLRYRNDWDIIPLTRIKNQIRREKIREVLKANNIGFNSFELIDLICKDRYNVFKNIDAFTKGAEVLRKNITFLSQPSLSEDLYNFLLTCGIPEDIASISLSSGKILPKFQGANIKNNNKSSYYSKDDIEYVFHQDRIIFGMFKEFNSYSNYSK